MRSKELSVEQRDRIMSRHRSEEGYQNISAALKVPKTKMGSIILKRKKLGTTKTLPRAGRPAKLSNRERRALVREVTKNPMVTLTELIVPLWRWENLPKGQRSLQHSTNQAFMVVVKRKPLLCKRHMTARLELAKRLLKTLRP